jgi:hypothetical protein
MRSAALLFAFAAILLPRAAQAADLTTLTCVSEHLDASTTALLDSDFEMFIRTPPDGHLPEVPPTAVRAVFSAGEACAALHRWNPAATKAAIVYALSVGARPGMERALPEFGVDPAGVASLYNHMPQPQHDAIMREGVNGKTLTNLMITGYGMHLFPVTEGRRVGRYIGTLLAADLARAEFLRS